MHIADVAELYHLALAQAWDPVQAVAYWGQDLGAYALGSNSRARSGKARRELGWAPRHGDVIAWVRDAIA